MNSERCRLPGDGERRPAPPRQWSDQCGSPSSGAPVAQIPAAAIATSVPGTVVLPGARPGNGRSPVQARPIAVLLASIVLFTLTGASCGRPTTVSLATVSLGTVAEEVEAPATVTARAAVAVTAPAEGTLATLYVDTGDAVKTGQILAVIDSPAAEERLADSEAALDAASRTNVGFGGGTDLSGRQRATDRAAARAFDDAQNAGKKIADPSARDALLAQVRAAQQQYEVTARAARNAVQAVLRGMAQLSSAMRALSAAQRLQARQAYDLAKSTVDALTLRAPIRGVVQLGGAPASTPALVGVLGSGAASGQLSSQAGAPTGGTPLGSAPGVDGVVPVGGRVAAGTPVLTVVDASHVGVAADVDQADVLLVKPGVSASIELDAAAGALYSGKVRSVDVLPTPSTRGGVSYRVRLTLGTGTLVDGREAPPPRPGMSATARLQVRQARDAVTVPAAAVFSTEGRDSVWVIQDGRAERIGVTVGVQGKDAVQIVSGVQPGQQVVVRGTDQVRQGQHVP